MDFLSSLLTDGLLIANVSMSYINKYVTLLHYSAFFEPYCCHLHVHAFRNGFKQCLSPTSVHSLKIL